MSVAVRASTRAGFALAAIAPSLVDRWPWSIVAHVPPAFAAPVRRIYQPSLAANAAAQAEPELFERAGVGN
jgi:hypothetical protein